MNIIDVIAIALAAFAAYRGWRSGFIRQAFEFGGGFLGLLAGVALGSPVASFFTNEPGVEGALIALATVFVGLSLGQALGFVIGHRLGQTAHRARLENADSALGSGLGIVVTVISVWLVGSVLVHGPSKPVAKALQKSQVLRAVNDTLPRPPNVFAYIQQYLNTSGFPQVFAGFPPSVGPPVNLPSNDLARRAAAAAQASTVRVVVPACGGMQLGSGWVAADSTVVTNAHVVAGGDEVTIEDSAGQHAGTVVLFDPKTDVAIVHVEGLAGPPLPLDTSAHERGTPGATLGFPGQAGGDMVVHRAAVQDRYTASGRDIYGRAIVEREVYEIRARVRQGDSGGPFVLPNGEVAGVIFAASTTDDDTGYALTGDEVSDEVERGARRSEPVGTGNCTR
ncbi:MAG: MarP family serine protease [Actinobacteria bacterium]|nr:MarP family serine protease [Actinomycetota bacterium]